MGLDIARSLGRRGIPVYGMDDNQTVVGGKSRFCQLINSPSPVEDENGFIDFMLDFARRQEQRPVFYPVSDDMVLLASRHRDALQEYYDYVMPPHKQMSQLLSKGGLSQVAERIGLPTPQAFTPQSRDELHRGADRLSYPVLLKPVESSYWHTAEIADLLRENLISGRPKVIVCETPDALLRQYDRISLYDNRMIVQEVVPGPMANLVYFCFYLNRESVPLGTFAGRKIRVLPLHYGSASYVQSFFDPELEEVALDFLKQIGFQGLGGLEFKRDARDGRYKLIEFNLRFGMWDGLGARCGVDNAYLAYCDALGLSVEPQRRYRENVSWVDWQRDVRAFFALRGGHELSLGAWLESLRGEKMWAIYSLEDPWPGIEFTLDVVITFLRRLTMALGKFLRNAGARGSARHA